MIIVKLYDYYTFLSYLFPNLIYKATYFLTCGDDLLFMA